MIEIRQIEPTRKELRKFVKFESDLYGDHPYFVPSLESDDMNTLDPKINPAFDFNRHAYFMAYRDGKPVGRIAAFVNETLNKKQGRRDARFGWFAFIDDREVSAALLKAAEDWAKEQGMTRLIGPLGLTDMDREGMLVEGFDELSTMATNYNYPYFPEHMAPLGYEKESDWVEFLLKVPESVPERFDRIADIVKQRLGLRVLKFKSRKRIKREYGHAIFHLINNAYKDLYEYCELTERQIDYYIQIYLGLLNLDLVTLIVDKDDRLVGVGISLPSMSRALQKSKGRYLPLGWYHLLKGLKGKNDRVDLLLVAVHPDYQNKGVNSLLFQDLVPQYIRHGYVYAESNPEMETNNKVQSQWELFEPRQHRRRRSYAKNL